MSDLRPRRLEFVVYGKAQTAGSKRGFGIKKRDGGTAFRVVDDNPKSRPWKNQVAQIAGEAVAEDGLFEGPLSVCFRFYRARPRGHFLTKGGLNAAGRRRPFPVTRPDALKLARAVEDALTGVLYKDDAQICDERLLKLYGEPERVEITIEEMIAAPPTSQDLQLGLQ